MKLYSLILSFCMISITSAQNVAEVIYHVDINDSHSISQVSTDYSLLFTDSNSTFVPVDKNPYNKLRNKTNLKVTLDKDSLVVYKEEVGNSSGKMFLDYHITDLKSNQIYFNQAIGSDLVDIKQLQSKLQWDIVTTSKDSIIAGFSTQKAYTTFMGRDYVAYFTSEINCDAAPYKFRGLPGLILSLKSSDGYFNLEFKEANFNSPKKMTYNLPVRTLTFTEYKTELVDYTQKRFEKAAARLRAAQPDEDPGQLTIEFNNFLEIPGIKPIVIDY